MSDRAGKLVDYAHELLEITATWADMQNALFAPGGAFSELFKTKAERAAFLDTEEYHQIRELIERKIRETGLIEGATPTGKFKRPEWRTGKM